MNEKKNTFVLHPYIISAALAAAIAIGFAIYTTSNTDDSAWDSYFYKQMAENPFYSTNPPFGYRILSPLLVYLLPFSIPAGFIVLTSFGLFAGSLTTYFICTKCGLGRWESLAAIPLFLFHGGSIWLFNAPCHVDAMATFVVSIAMLSLLTRAYGLTAPAMTLGAFNKESALFLLPVYWASRYSRENKKHCIVDCVLVSSAVIAVFLLIRYVWFSLTMQGFSFDELPYKYDFFSFYLSETKRLWGELGHTRFFHPNTYTFGAATLCGFSILGYFNSPRELKCGLFLLPLTTAQLFFVTGDLRLKHLAIPILIPLALRGVVRCFERVLFRRIAFVSLCLLYFWKPDSLILGVALPAICLSIKKISAYNHFNF